jgi:hypothetical protein
MPGQPTNRVQYTVACSCGARMSLDSRSFGHPRVCKGCGGSVTVAWGRDPKTRKTIPVAVTQAKSRAAAPAKSPYTAFCGCGYTRPVPAGEANTTPKCPGCGKLMVVDKAPDPKSLKIQKMERPKPSAPLVPLHLRPPLRVRIPKGVKFFDCPCGERNLIRDGQIGRPTQCPACDRHHLVEELREAPPGPAPAPSTGKPYGGKLPAPPKPAGPPRPLKLGEALCPCYEIIPPRTSRTGKNFECAKCGRKGRIDVTTDEKGAPVMKAVVTHEPTGQNRPSASPAPPVQDRPSVLYAPPPRPAPVPEVSFEELPVPAPASQGVFETPVEFSEEGEAAPLPDDAQAVICTCAAELLVSHADVGQTIQCPMCTTVMTVEEVPDSRGAPTLRVRGIGSFDQPDWKLDDFK